MTSNISRLSLRTAIVSLSIHTVVAADGVWTNPAGGSWAEATNWASATIADGSGAIADFSTLDLTANAAVTLDGARTIGTLRFSDTAASNDWSLTTGTAGPLTLAAASTPVISVGSGTTTIGAVLAGTQGLQKTGAGILTLSGANIYTGQLLVSQGTLKAGNATSTGESGTGNETVVASGATFDLNGQVLSSTEVYRLSGSGVGGIGAFVNNGGAQQNGLNKLVLSADASVGGTARFDARAGTMPTIDLAGFTLTKVGTNQVSLVGRELITDPAEPADTVTAVLTPGNLVINQGVFAIENTATANATGTITINSGGIFGLWANKAGRVSRPIVSNNGTIQNLGSNAVLNSPASIPAASTLTVTGTATTYMAGAISGAGNLVKSGSGGFTFAGNTFTGKTTINEGYFGVTGEGGFGAAPASFVADHITLGSGAAGGIGNVVNGYYYGPTLGPNRGITLTETGGGFDVYGHQGGRSTIAVNGVISGPGTLYKSGGGSLLLNAANTYAGGTSVSNGPSVTENIGALNIANYAGLGAGPVTFTNTGAITGLQFSKAGTLANNITLAPDPTTNRFYVNPGTIATIGGTISGGTFNGGSVMLDGGTLVLPGDHPYLSTTTVNSGTLIVDGNILDSDFSVNSGGELGGSGAVRQIILKDGSRIIAAASGLETIFGVTAERIDKGVDIILKTPPAGAGSHTLDVVGYGDDVDGLAPDLNAFNVSAFRSGVLTDDTVANKITLSYTSSALTWSGGSGKWDAGVTTSWAENDSKFYQGDAVTFNDPGSETTVTLEGALSPSLITVNGANNYIFTQDTTPETGKPGSIVSGSIVKNGTGILVLASANTFAGGTTVNGGTLSLSATPTTPGGSPLALGTGAVTVNAGATLKLWFGTGNYAFGNPITLDGGKLVGEDGVNSIGGILTLGAAGGTSTPKIAGKDLQFRNTITGSGKLTLHETGGASGITTLLAGNNTYSGGTDILSGTIRMADYDTVFGTGGITVAGSSMIATSSGGGVRTLANAITVNSGATATFDGGYAAVVLNGNISGPGIVAQASSGLVAVGGNNTYTGGTNLGGSGLFRLDSPGALGTTGVITFSGGTLQATAANTADYSARFSTTATGQGFRLNTNGQSVTWASPLTGATAVLWKLGEGTLSVTGASTFGGGTNVQGGVLATPLIADTGATPLGTFGTAGGSYISFGGGTLRYTGPTATTARYLWNDQVSGGIEVTNPATTLAFSATAGTINKPFTKSGPGTLTLADAIDGAATVTVTGGTLNLNGTNTYTGLTTISAGTLAMATASLPNGGDVRITTGATLQLGFTGEDLIDQLFIDGVEMAKGTWGSMTSAAANKSPLITGTGILNVQTGPTGGGGSGYDAWATTSGLTSANNGKSMDPDGDGLNNLGEFAFDGAALSGVSSGKVVMKKATIGGKDYLTLTLPVLAGATFNEDLVSSVVSGVIYRIQGAEDLSDFTLEVVEVTGTDAAAIQAGLPGLTSSAWTYRTFRPVADMSLAPKQFLRALANEPQ